MKESKIYHFGKELTALQHFSLVPIGNIRREDNINVNQIVQFVFDKVENIVGNGENAGYQHFLLFPLCFQKVSFPECQKSASWVKG